MKQYRNWIIVLAVVLAFPLALAAQNVARGSIGGTIYDTSGGIVPDAKLTLTSEYGVREGKSNPDGTFVFSSLETGKYTLRVEYTNFKVTEIKDINVRLNERTTVDVKLEAGAITQTITVTEASIGLDTTTTTSGGTISADLFKNAPVGRNIMDIPIWWPGSTMVWAPGVPTRRFPAPRGWRICTSSTGLTSATPATARSAPT